MCGYSLENLVSRECVIGETLVTVKFATSMSTGLCSSSDRAVAVCLAPGTELAFDKPIEFDGFWGLGLHSRHYGVKTARFVSLALNRGGPYRDGLELENGGIVLLNELALGHTVKVIQLPHVRTFVSKPQLRGKSLSFSVIAK